MTEDGPGQASTDPFSRLTGLIAKSTAVVTAAVAFLTGLNECSDQSRAQTTSFREAVAAEETWWGDLHQAYVDTFDTTTAENPALQSAKRIAICSLSNRIPPDFNEYGNLAVASGMRRDATNRLKDMKAFLQGALMSEKLSGEEVAEACRTGVFDAEQDATPLRPADGSLPQDAADVGVSRSFGSVLQTETLNAGRANGWDIDVFWCHGDNETSNRETARRIAVKLIGDGERIEPGVLLGRVRLRGLPVDRQAAEDIPPRQTFIAWDAGDGEFPAAEAMQRRLNAPPAEITFQLERSAAVTPWYLSVFVCRTANGSSPPST